MKTMISWRIVLLGLTFFVIVSAQAITMDDIGIIRVSEDFGKWHATFNWSEMDEYKSSVSHENSESGTEKAVTDSLIISSFEDRSKILKLSVITYSSTRTVPINSSRLKSLANETLKKSGVCGEINTAERMIGGQQGIYASGLKCPLNQSVALAAYLVDYHLDGARGVLASDAIGIILSTHEHEITNRLIDSIRIEQKE